MEKAQPMAMMDGEGPAMEMMDGEAPAVEMMDGEGPAMEMMDGEIVFGTTMRGSDSY